MKTIILLLLTSVASFVLGLSIQNNNQQKEQVGKMKRTTSIGGVFFKCKIPTGL